MALIEYLQSEHFQPVMEPNSVLHCSSTPCILQQLLFPDSGYCEHAAMNIKDEPHPREDELHPGRDESHQRMDQQENPGIRETVTEISKPAWIGTGPPPPSSPVFQKLRSYAHQLPSAP